MSNIGIDSAIRAAAATHVAGAPNALGPAQESASLTRITLPAAPTERQAPRREALPLSPPRSMDGGSSPLAPSSLSDSNVGAGLIDGDSGHSARHSAALLPASAQLAAYGRNGRGEVVYLEQARWLGHIVPAHITEPPQARGKRTTTWWPVQHTATGASSMSTSQVLDTVMDAVRLGRWQNAPRGTLLAVYELPHQQAKSFGVSEVKVSAAPDGRILSAYPTAGWNVLAVKEGAAQQPQETRLRGAAAGSATRFDATPSVAV